MQSVLGRVVDCVATATRYPKQLLVPDADLENDLGMDSVKRVEIVAALADEFRLDLVTQERDPSIRTIAHVAAWVEALLAAPTGEQRVAPLSDSNGAPPQMVHTPSPSAAKQQGDTPAVNGGGHNGRFDVAEEPRPTSAVATQSFKTVPAGQPTPLGSLHGRVALVTGSGRGVGKTIARVLAARGATVIVNSFHSRDQGEQTTREINESGGSAIHIWGSVANPAQVDAIFSQIENQIGHLDILVCNASDGKIGSFTDISQEDWDRAFRTNVSGHHQCAISASRLMERRGGGSIVTMSSVAAQQFVEGLGGQGVIKASVESLTRYLACALAPLGIRTNCVSGGPVYGDLISMYPEARATHNYWENIIPDGKMCSPMDLASTIAFLLSDEAQAINGAVWTVDHGLSTRSHSRPLPQAAAAQLATKLPVR